MHPWGRLTLQSGKPRMDDNVSSSNLYYTPFENNDYPELALPLNGQIISSNLYDVYLKNDNSAIFLTSAWPSNSVPAVLRCKSRGLYFDAEDNLYIGTIHAIQDNLIAWQIRPPAQPYGCNNELGVFNAYNRLPFLAINRDSNSIWEFAASSLRYADNSNQFRINWVDGVGDVWCQGSYEASVAGVNNQAAAATIGVGLDQNAYPLNWDGYLQQAAMTNPNTGMALKGCNWVNGLIGRHSWQAIEQSTSVPIQFFGNNFAVLTVNLSV